MKKKTLISIIAGTIMAICMGAGVSCAQEDTPEQKKTLETPQNFTLNELEVLSWDCVENARGYCIEINDEEYRTEETSLDIFNLLYQPGDYTISIYAYGKNGFLASEYASLSYSIPSLQGKLEFKSINGGKEVSITGVDVSTIEGKLVFPDMVGNFPVTKIEARAFMNAKKISGVLLPQNLEKVEFRAFSTCEALKRVTWGANIEEIPDYCFSDCAALEEISIPNGVRKIGENAFNNCGKLERLSLPSTVRSIEQLGLDNLQYIEIDEGNGVYKSVENKCVLLRENKELLVGTVEGFIPNETSCIGKGAFRGMPFQSITIPASVRTIKQKAFSGCANLTEVIIEEGLEIIKDQAFSASGLREIILPKSLVSIGNAVFSGCDMQSLRIPENLTEITGNPMSGCDLLELEVASENSKYESRGNCIIEKGSNVLLYGCLGSKIPDDIVEIGNSAFMGVPLTTIEIPDGVVEIGAGAFSNCDELSYVRIGKGVKRIGGSAFYSCESLTNVQFPEGLESIGSNAFADCFNLMGAVIPQSVANIGSEAFRCVDVYLSNTTIPEGWEQGVYRQWADNCRLIYGCTYGYDGVYPYVTAYTKIDEIVNGNIYTSIRISFKIYDRPVVVPKRQGYIFKGWSMEENGEIYFAPVEVKAEMLVYDNGMSFYREAYVGGLTEEQYETLSDGDMIYAVWEKIG